MGGSRRVVKGGEAYREFRKKGYVVFDRALDRGLVAEMQETFGEYFNAFRKVKPDLKRLLMHLPFRSPFYDPRFFENPMVMKIIHKVLGRNHVLGYFGSETAMPGADFMKVHFDLAFLTKRTYLNYPLSFLNNLLGSLRYCYGIQVSVPLVDSTEENAPFEIWPATNRFSLRRRPSEVVLMPAGSLLVRDIRNLHRGTPHRGNLARPFLSLVYLRSWVPRWKLPEIPSEVYKNLSEQSRQLLREASIGQPVPDPEAWAVRAR